MDSTIGFGPVNRGSNPRRLIMAKATDYIEVCPKCGSPDFHIENDAVWSGDRGFYVCNDCGNSAKMFPQVKKEKLGKFRKEAERKVSKPKKKETKKEKPLFSPSDIIALILGVAFIFLAGVIGFLVIVGGYFALKRMFSKK